MRSRPTILLATTAPQSLFINDHLINIKHAENVCTFVWQKSVPLEYREPNFVIHENKQVLDCCS